VCPTQKDWALNEKTKFSNSQDVRDQDAKSLRVPNVTSSPLQQLNVSTYNLKQSFDAHISEVDGVRHCAKLELFHKVH